jgi:hypothetical protein
MTDVIPLLGLPDPPQHRRDYYVPCPCCDAGRDRHLNINTEKDVFRCPRCGMQGGVFDLYSLFTGVPRERVLEELRHLRCGSSPSAQFFARPCKTDAKHLLPAGPPCADISVRDAVYRALLQKLLLAWDHQQNLLNRGLSMEAVAQNGYRTTPLVGCRTLAKQLLAEGHILAGVPGFYCAEDGQWRFVPEPRGILYYPPTNL